MKKLRNTKGFTLIELLAVIVVLAIIMVIATTQVNATIKKSRANSFVESYQMMYKSIKASAIAGNTADEAKEELEASKNDYSVSVTGDNKTGSYTLGVCAYGLQITVDESAKTAKETNLPDVEKPSGKFSNMDLTKYYVTGSSDTNDELQKIESNIGDTYYVTPHCIWSSYQL